ncbi:zinc finger protein 530 [Tribolium castaneum]|uniref:Zinc finger protein 37-like Protein n=1 Tax=Tribolium castaneum TaxID=7070 RepID=D7EJD1_TRICA|nr:PREDICTED: zinc finger protein 530 [Tribolium castaneum]EFA12659.1 Zinc finger protein 37-like Protein [Tribolium castaneum]|eukprot:XP_008200102.1 PREDICTED: zinc finger protein 530 [Tribolium castaneum]
MSTGMKMCFTCRKVECGQFINVRDYDTDKIFFLEKLKTCITNLVETDNMEMCPICVKLLRISYKFHMQVLTSQDILKRESFKDESDRIFNTSDDFEVKDDPDTFLSTSDDFVKSDCDSDNSANKKPKRRATKKTFLCDHCASEYPTKWQLRKHLARVHDDFRKFVCNYCGKEFKQSYHLKEHITSHTGEKNYSCPICEKTFQRLSSQRRHVKSHDAPPGHKTKRTPFLCTICGKSFPFSNGVQRHMRIHLGIKNFECSFCNRRFTQSTHLHVHMRTHTGEKPYICDTCGEKFSLKSCLLKHISTRHCKADNLANEMPIFFLTKEGFEQS